MNPEKRREHEREDRLTEPKLGPVANEGVPRLSRLHCPPRLNPHVPVEKVQPIGRDEVGDRVGLLVTAAAPVTTMLSIAMSLL